MEEKNQPITTSVSRWKGVIAGILGAGFFGFIPVFSKPVLAAGVSIVLSFFLCVNIDSNNIGCAGQINIIA